tara:strand:+ start:811 stop:1011 length:201 start_codon:yes stop_codon:yes gene_type:complete
MDERNLKFKKGDLIEWTELCGEGFIVNKKGYGVIVDTHPKNCTIYRNNYSDVIRFNLEQVELINAA